MISTLVVLAALARLSIEAPVQDGVQGQELTGLVFSIEDGEQNRHYFGNITIKFVGFDSVRTDDNGFFRIKIPASVRPGQEITLRHNKKGYEICTPLFGKQLVPSDLIRPIEIRMLPTSSKLFGLMIASKSSSDVPRANRLKATLAAGTNFSTYRRTF